MGKTINDRYSIEDYTLQKEGRIIKKDMYGLCLNGDPKKLLVHKSGTPQWNKNRSVCEWAINKAKEYKDMDLGVVYFAIAYEPRRNY